LVVEENIWAEEGRGNKGVKKTQNEELSDLYSSPNNIRVNKSRRMGWAGFVARMGIEEERCIQGFVGET
jgi:hypothetical protein